MNRIIVTWLTVLAGLLVAGFSFAASGQQGVALIVEGADADAVRREISESIPQGIAVQDGAALSAAIANQGVRGSVGDALANPKTRKPTLAAIRKALKQVGLPAALSARSKKAKHGAREIRVVLIVRAQAQPMIEENISVAKGAKATPQLSPLLAVPLQDLANAPPAAAAAEPEPEAAAPAAGDKPAKTASKETKEEEEPAPSTEKDEAAPKKARGPVNFNNGMVIVEAGVDVGTRQLKYNGVWQGALRAYAQPGIPAWSLGVQLYPAASQNIPVAKDLGIVARYADSLVFESKTTDGTQTARGKWTRYAVGVRYRIPLAEKGPLFGLEATYGGWKFDFAGTDIVVAELPSVDYKFIRAAADARVPVGPAAISLGFGYMNMMGAGKFKEKFPHATLGGVDAKIGISYGLTPWLEAKAGFLYTRIFSSMNSQEEDKNVPGIGIAGGAIDQYFTGNVGLSAVF